MISTFDLEVLSKKYDIRIWLCKRIGRRWSFLVGAGEQRSLPSELIYENPEYGIFVQGEDFDHIRLKNEIKILFETPKIMIT
ncbi:MAG: hypothetical protein ACOYXC_11375 [Candidatus Rifleibacteriota bacterium]